MTTPNSSGAGQPGSNTGSTPQETASGNTDMSQQISTPIQGSPAIGSGDDSDFGWRPGLGREHYGVDIPCPIGTPCYAPVDGKIGEVATTSGFDDGGMVHFVFPEDIGAIKAGDVIGWGHVYEVFVEPGETVTRGQKIATSGHAAPHVHFIYQPGGNGSWDGTADPEPIYNALKSGTAPTGGAGGGGARGGSGSGTGAGAESLAKSAAFATYFNLSSLMERATAQALIGEKSLMNDKPLFPFVQQLVEASLRNFQSMPNGNFYAFYPDYFGGMGHRTPYWQIRDVEVISGQIDLSDEALATHVFIVGSTSSMGSISLVDQINSSGVVTIFNAFMVNFLDGNFAPDGTDPFEETPPGKKAKKKTQDSLDKWQEESPTLANKDNAIAFLKKYGARPHYEEMPMVRSPYYELFLAFQRFCLLWSKQFLTTFELTFMPELFPGGIVEFPEHGIQCYIDEVTHNCSYQGGFTTTVSLSAPASTDRDPTNPINRGMVRSDVLSRIRVPEDPANPTKGDKGERG